MEGAMLKNGKSWLTHSQILLPAYSLTIMAWLVLTEFWLTLPAWESRGKRCVVMGHGKWRNSSWRKQETVLVPILMDLSLFSFSRTHFTYWLLT